MIAYNSGYPPLMAHSERITMYNRNNMKSEVKKCKIKCCCNNARAHGMCDKHRRAEWVKNNPVRDKFNNLKGNAKRRRIQFNLTFDEYKKFCEETDYAEKCGKKINCLHIDRIRRNEGYSYSNIQILTCSENVFKYNYLERNIKSIDPELVKQFEEDNTPFMRNEIQEFQKQFIEDHPF